MATDSRYLVNYAVKVFSSHDSTKGRHCTQTMIQPQSPRNNDKECRSTTRQDSGEISEGKTCPMSAPRVPAASVPRLDMHIGRPTTTIKASLSMKLRCSIESIWVYRHECKHAADARLERPILQRQMVRITLLVFSRSQAFFPSQARGLTSILQRPHEVNQSCKARRDEPQNKSQNCPLDVAPDYSSSGP